jgi:methylaspartate ammonia-lyase
MSPSDPIINEYPNNKGLTIVEVLTVPVRSGFFVDDQAAIRAGAQHEGFTYIGDPVTPGFRQIRQAGEAVSAMLLCSDGSLAYGDCSSVQYSGAAGRDLVFSAEQAQGDIACYVAPLLVGRDLTSFRDLASQVDEIRTEDGSRLHTAIRYGVTQALLDAVAQSRRLTMAEVVRDEYATGIDLAPVPMFAQTGDDRYLAAEKMILKETEVLPHGLINNVDTKLGRNGELLEEYLRWLIARIGELRVDPGYQPRLHFDTYGTVGIAFDGDVMRVASYLARLGEIASPLQLVIEHPIDAGSREAQIETYVRLRAELARLGSSVQIAVDEWCNTLEDIRLFVEARAADIIHVKMPDLGGINNTIEALLLVREHGLAAYCGGSCNETDRSAQVSAHLAMACGAAQVLAKPGMGVDEGLMIVGNEMVRTAAIARARQRIAAVRQ